MTDERTCHLPVVRKRYDDTADAYEIYVDRCSGSLYLERAECLYLDDEGNEATGTGPEWKVVCANGHVLILADPEGDDDFTKIPWEPRYLGFVTGVVGSITPSGGPTP